MEFESPSVAQAVRQARNHRKIGYRYIECAPVCLQSAHASLPTVCLKG